MARQDRLNADLSGLLYNHKFAKTENGGRCTKDNWEITLSGDAYYDYCVHVAGKLIAAGYDNPDVV